MGRHFHNTSSAIIEYDLKGKLDSFKGVIKMWIEGETCRCGSLWGILFREFIFIVELFALLRCIAFVQTFYTIINNSVNNDEAIVDTIFQQVCLGRAN